MIQKGDRFGFCMIKYQKARMTKHLTPFFNSKMTSVQMRFVSRLGAVKFCYHYANRLSRWHALVRTVSQIAFSLNNGTDYQFTVSSPRHIVQLVKLLFSFTE